MRTKQVDTKVIEELKKLGDDEVVTGLLKGQT